MKTGPFVIVIVLLCSFTLVNAQFRLLGEGPVFEEPENGRINVTQLQNGNTIFLRLYTKRHFKITIDFYDKDHKKINEGSFVPDDPDLALNLENVFEIGGDVAVFLRTNIKHIPVLQRLIIDGNKGTVKSFTNVPDVTPVAADPYEEIELLGQSFSSQIVRGPDGKRYAILSTEKNTSDNTKKIQILLFDSNHKIVNSLFVNDSSTGRHHVYANYLTFIDNDNIAILSSATASKKDVIIFNLKNNEQRQVMLPNDYGTEVANEIIKINPDSKQLVIAYSLGNLKKEALLNSYLIGIDLLTGKELFSKQLPLSPAMKENTALFGLKKHEAMALQNLFFCKNGNMVVVYEGVEIYTWTFTSGRTSTSTFLGNTVIEQFDRDGNEAGSLLIPKLQKSIDVEYRICHHGGELYSSAFLFKGSQYKSFTYFAGPQKSYILFNDSPDNTEKMKKGKLETTVSSKEGDGYYIDLSKMEIMGTRNLMFEKQGSNITPGLFAASDYDSTHNVFVTLKLQPEGRDKGLRLVWLQPL